MNAATPGASNSSGPSFAGGAQQVVVEQIVQFHEDGAVASSSSGPDRVAPKELETGKDLTSNEISSVLARPILMTTFDWSASTGSLGELARIHLPADWFKQSMVKQKLANFKYLRCDFVVEVQINAQPFNAGALIGWFEPLADQQSARPSSVATLAGITGYPSTQWRCGEETALKLTIPFITPLSHIDLVTGLGTFGDFVLDIMSPLTGSADVTGAIWLWAENVKFEMPTGLTTRVNAQANTDWEVPTGCEVQQPAPVQVKEEKSAFSISSVMGAASKITGALSFIPSFTLFASAASVVLGATSKVAALFGWSKPLDDRFADPVTLATQRHMATYNGRSEAKVLALDAQNVVNVPTDLFRTTEDEMAINHIIRKEIFMDVFDWTAAKATGSLLWRWAVDPAACKKAANPLPSNTVAAYNTYLSYLSGLATLWRGTIKYHFKLIKTPFHSGRIQIAFIPGATLDTDITTVDFAQVYKQVYDIRQTTDIEFEVPFTWQAPWKVLYTSVTVRPYNLLLTSYDPAPTGIIIVTVLNSLRAPSTAADHIETLVFTSAGNDFQFAIPKMADSTALATRKNEIPAPTYTMNAQIGMYPCTEDMSEKPNTIGVGEFFVSLRQLLKRYILFDGVEPGGVQLPFIFRNAPGKVQDVVTPQNPFLWVSELYRFYAGSLRILYEVGTDVSVHKLTLVPGGEPDLQHTGYLPTRAAPVVLQAGRIEPVMEVSVPFYQQCKAMPTQVGNPRIVHETGMNAAPFTSILHNTGTQLTIPPFNTAYRSIGEDFSFGFLLGPPVTWKWPPGTPPIP